MRSLETETDELLDDLFESGRAAWPDVDLSRARFVAYARERLPAPEAGQRTRLEGADLYLACACRHEIAGALATFERVFLVRVPSLLRQMDPSPAFADEVCQKLRERLFLGGDEARIASYNGRGSLFSWLRVAAVRTALNLLEGRHPERNLTLSHATMQAMPDDDPELEAIKTQYRQPFQAALARALAELPLEQRRALKLHLVGGMTTTQIGVLMRVHHSTVVRWLAAARAEARAKALEALRLEIGGSISELASLAGLLLSRLDVSLGSCLGD